jgi:hypothetical protein
MNIHIAGLGPLSWKNQRVFNFDLTDIVDGERAGSLKKYDSSAFSMFGKVKSIIPESNIATTAV